MTKLLIAPLFLSIALGCTKKITIANAEDEKLVYETLYKSYQKVYKEEKLAKDSDRAQLLIAETLAEKAEELYLTKDYQEAIDLIGQAAETLKIK